MTSTPETISARLASWDPNAAELRAWSDAELLAALASLGIDTDASQMAAEAAAVSLQAELEDQWLGRCTTTDEAHRVLVWMAVQELWERWSLPAWPKDRLSRMTLYLIDPDFSVQWADSFHAPTIAQVLDALEGYLRGTGSPRAAMDELMAMAELSDAAWPAKFVEAMTEWTEIGNISMARRGGEVLTLALGSGHALAWLAVALISARLLERAVSAALEVPLEAQLDPGQSELIAYLCMAGGDIALADHWLARHDSLAASRKSEQTYAIEAVRDHLTAWRQAGRPAAAVVPDPVRAAARQAASWSSFYVLMSFAGTGAPGGHRDAKGLADY